MSSSNTRQRTTLLSLTSLRNQLEQTSTTLGNRATTLEQTSTTLGNRATTLEQTASIRSFDTLAGPVTSFSIPFDLSDNESVEINITLRMNGTGSTNVLVRPNNTSGPNRAWDDWIGYYWAAAPSGQFGAPTIDWIRTGQEGQALLLVDQNGRGANIRIKMYRSFDSGTPSGLYIGEVQSVYRYVSRGISKSDMIGSVSTYIPTGITVSLSNTGAGSNVTGSYSIIQDRRRTALNGALL